MDFRKKTAVALIALMPFAVVGCADEDDDGAVTDEEVGEVDDAVEEGTDELEDEAEEGADELDDD